VAKKPNLLLKAFVASCVIEGCIILVALISHSGFPMFHLVAWELIGMLVNLDRIGVLAAEIILSAMQILLLVPLSYCVLRWTEGGSSSGLD